MKPSKKKEARHNETQRNTNASISRTKDTRPMGSD